MRALCFSLLTVTSALLLSSCGGSGDPGPSPSDTEPPTVMHVSLAEGQTDVGLLETIEVTFSEAMDASTFCDTTVFVAGRGPRGRVSYDAATWTASFMPDTLYASETLHFFVASERVTDLAGNALVPDSTSFTTGPLDCGHLEDWLEPNDGVLETVPIEIGTWYRTLAGCGDDVDYFEFSLEEETEVGLEISVRHAEEMTVVVGLHGADGQPHELGEMEAQPGQVLVERTVLPEGTHLASVEAMDPGYVLYDLRVVVGTRR